MTPPNLTAASKTVRPVWSVEMFEHMANWHALLSRTRTWLKPEGRLFLHVFSHRTRPYRFDHAVTDTRRALGSPPSLRITPTAGTSSTAAGRSSCTPASAPAGSRIR